MDFRIVGLSPARFAPLFAMGDAELARHGALRCLGGRAPGFPCRVSLQDAEPEEELILTHYEHHAVDSPYRSSHAIYVRAAARAAYDAVNEIPPSLRTRILSLRAFDARGLMLDCDLAEDMGLRPLIQRLLSRQDTAYVHAHYARAGCFAARIDRAHALDGTELAPTPRLARP